MLKRLAGVFLLSAMTCVGVSAQATHAHHVVFVLSSADQDDWHTAMILADHFLAGVKPEPSEVEVLAYGGGIDSLKAGASTAKEIVDLEQLGVHFVACETAMRALHIAKSDLASGVTSVPSGVVELVRKQETGWSYVKVGR
ncbi:DsrE family protein [Granulicella arctica]|uniref:DsrE family protein n=1 Tax=Granulicella arctica TaxID=940613 RepID=UPI0021E081AA|nr:DsrE family protein [Granulicella arctica]